MKIFPRKTFGVFTKLLGIAVKTASYVFHFFFPKKRFEIPMFAYGDVPAAHEISTQKIPKIVWMTNFSNKCTLPIFLNFLHNKAMARNFEFRYVSTEEREVFFKKANFDFMPDIAQIYEKILDGAAQADFWRLATLYKFGGVYLDIDATLACPISWNLDGIKDAIFTGKNRDDVTNFFLASTPGNEIFRETLLKIRSNILAHSGTENVFVTTGPAPLQNALRERNFNFRKRREICTSGAFTNEHFQYLDKPRGKWIHKRATEIFKK